MEVEEDSLALFDAAVRGDVGFLREALKIRNTSANYLYFLAQDKHTTYNIIQLAIMYHAHDFVREAFDKLGPVAVLLICQWDLHGENSLHSAAKTGNLEMAKILVSTYKDNIDKVEASDLSSIIVEAGLAELIRQPPWLVQDSESMTPLHNALFFRHEDVAIYISSLDRRLLTEIYSFDRSAICFAISKNCGRYVEYVLNSGWNYSLEGKNGTTALHIASLGTEKNMKGAIKVLLERHPELIAKLDNKGDSILSYAVSNNSEWLVKLMLTKEVKTGSWIKACRKLIWLKNYAGNTLLHMAARKGNLNIAKLIVEAYNSSPNEFPKESLLEPGVFDNSKGDTPFIVALKNKHDEFALYMLSLGHYGSVFDTSGEDEGALYLAVLGGCERVSEKLLTYRRCSWWSPNGMNPLHVASNCTEKVAKLLMKKYPRFVKAKDSNGKTPLCIAAEKGTEWLVKVLLRSHSSVIKDIPLAWKSACKNGHLQMILAFTELGPYLVEVCRNIKDTPLHHVKLQTHKEYEDLLLDQTILEFKNMQDSNGATPLHRAIERNDIMLAKLLWITNGTDTTISDINGKQALDLLAKRYDESEDWAEMCHSINLNPKLKTAYVLPRTNLKNMQGTLSVVAALLATITFAAAFTIPGGFNNSNGDAILATDAAFLVFMLSNTFAMCCSLIVLFFLIWAMVWDKDPGSMVLIDRSVLVLQLSLCGTVVAFMTGVFAMVSKKSLWVAIIIIGMCSMAFLTAAIPMYADRLILYKLVERFIPTSDRGRRKGFKNR